MEGIVLIDGGNPTFYANYNESVALLSNRLFEGIRRGGLLRALGSRNTLRNINENAQKVLKAGRLGDIPLVILTAGQDYKWKASQIKLRIGQIIVSKRILQVLIIISIGVTGR